MSGVTLSNVVKKYGETQVIHGVELTFDPGDFVSLSAPLAVASQRCCA